MEEKIDKKEIENIDKSTTPQAGEAKSLFQRPIILASIVTITALIILGGIFLYLRMQSTKTPVATPTATENKIPSEIYFDTTEVTLLTGETSSAEISINTAGNKVGGVVLAIKYNPRFLRNVKLEQIKDPTSAISSSLTPTGTIYKNDPNGEQMLILALPDKEGLSGRGTVAKVTFSKAPTNIAATSTEISFFSNSGFTKIAEGSIPVNTNTLKVNFFK